MKVLVAVASRHGSTIEIGEVIASTLRSSGMEVDMSRIEDVASLHGYDAFILGSGVYAGHWLRPAREFVDRHEAALAQRPVWLFSSGPVGDPPTPLENPAEVVAVAKRVGSLGHRLFAGKIESDDLGIAEKALVKLVRAPAGDFRPWSEIAVWAEVIAADLKQSATDDQTPAADTDRPEAATA
jgi:menaquinone-dependent protoporphyrinogen oxidase